MIDPKNQGPVEEPEELADADDSAIGRALRKSLLVLLALAILAASAWLVIHRKPPAPKTQLTHLSAPVTPSPAPAEMPLTPFIDVTAASGIAFTHYNGASGDKLLSTIVAVVPAIDWSEARRQLGKPFEENDTYPWNGFCAVPIEERRKVPISYCGAPNGTLLSTGQPAAGSPGYFDGLPCTALARLLENQCQAQDSPYPLFKHPIFPQSNFISETFHSSYTRHASYFDLGRFQVQRALRDLGVRRVSGAEACAEVGRLTY